MSAFRPRTQRVSTRTRRRNRPVEGGGELCAAKEPPNRVGQLCGGGYFGLVGRPGNVGGTSAQLDADFDRGDLDLMHAKRRSEEQRGISLYREPLVWTGHRDSAIGRNRRLARLPSHRPAQPQRRTRQCQAQWHRLAERVRLAGTRRKLNGRSGRRAASVPSVWNRPLPPRSGLGKFRATENSGLEENRQAQLHRTPFTSQRREPQRIAGLAYRSWPAEAFVVGMAEREGFEPSRRFPAYTLSRRAPSTTRPSLRIGCFPGWKRSGKAGQDRRERGAIYLSAPLAQGITTRR